MAVDAELDERRGTAAIAVSQYRTLPATFRGSIGDNIALAVREGYYPMHSRGYAVDGRAARLAVAPVSVGVGAIKVYCGATLITSSPWRTKTISAPGCRCVIRGLALIIST